MNASFDPKNRYKLGKDPGDSKVGLLLAILVVLILCAGGFAYWQFYAKDVLAKEEAKAKLDQMGVPQGRGGAGGGAPGGIAPPPAGGAIGGPPGGMMGLGGGRPGGAMGQGGGRPGGGMMGQGGGRPGGGMRGMGGGGMMGMGGNRNMGGGPGAPPPPPPPPPRGDEEENAATKASDLIPANATAFVSIRVSDILAQEDIKNALNNPLVKDQFKQVQAMEAQFGMKLDDVERVVSVVVRPEPDAVWGIVQTKKPIDRKVVLRAIQAQPGETIGEGKAKRTFYPSGLRGADMALHFVNDNVVVLGTSKGIETYFKTTLPARQGALADALKLVEGTRHVVMAGELPDELRKQARSALPKEFAPYLGLLEFKTLVCSFDGKLNSPTDIDATYPDATKAKAAKETLDGVVKLVRDSLKGIEMPADARAATEKILEGIKIDQKESLVSIKGDGAHNAILTALLLPAVQKVRQAAGRTTTQNNFKQITLALHNYESANGKLPPAVITSKDGKPLYSWRVALLPYLEHDNLYRQLKLDEPWDSEHNKQFLDKMPMPKVFELADVPAAPNMTHIQVFTGKGTMFEEPGKARFGIAGIPDGTVNTLFTVEAAKPVHWAAPSGDIPYSVQTSPLEQLRKRPGGVIVGLFDGSVSILPKDLTEKNLRSMIDPADTK